MSVRESLPGYVAKRELNGVLRFGDEETYSLTEETKRLILVLFSSIGTIGTTDVNATLKRAPHEGL